MPGSVERNVETATHFVGHGLQGLTCSSRSTIANKPSKTCWRRPLRSEGFCGLGIVSEEALIQGTNRLRTIAFMVPFGAAASAADVLPSPIAADGCHGSLAKQSQDGQCH